MIHLLHATRAALLQIRRRKTLAAVVTLAAAGATASLGYAMSDAIARNEQTAAALASPDVRSIVVRASSPNQQQLPYALTDDIASLAGVVTAVTLGQVDSTRNTLWASGSESTGLFEYHVTKGPSPVTLIDGRAPKPGEAILSSTARTTLGIAPGAPGRLATSSATLGVVGTYTIDDLGALTNLLATAALTPAAPAAEVVTVAMLVAQPADVAAVANAARSILGGLPPQSYTISYDDRAADIEATVRAGARQGVRVLGIVLVAISSAIIGLVSFVHVLVRRRDIARQRALGRTRLDVLTVTTIQITMLALLGANLGGLATVIALQLRHIEIQPTITVAAICLVTIVSALATIPGAAFGAARDPAASLRVP